MTENDKRKQYKSLFISIMFYSPANVVNNLFIYHDYGIKMPSMCDFFPGRILLSLQHIKIGH
nr:MAG TPA: hypothetical protein [Caudoviricetes sp.]DAQ99409.1 MAG TPA: hypothetical protein [Caudoviricetes sp.]